MRKRLSSPGIIALIALMAAACGSSASSGQAQGQPPDPQHHYPTAPPARPAPTPYDGVTFPEQTANPVVDTDEDRVSTFAMDVDTASYTIAQRFVRDGNLPDPASVRIEEWVNAFDQGYPASDELTFAIHLDAAPAPFLDGGDLLLRLGIKARDVSRRARPDAALTFVIDTSGSMDREDRLELVKDSLRKLVRGLGRGDSIAVVAFGDDAKVVLPPTRADDDETILAAIDTLRPGGSTNLEAGLRLGYSLARETLSGQGIDRIVLASDGVANVGLTDADAILRQIRDDASAGIQLVAIGVGMGNYNDALLERLADQGDGFYAYVNELSEARRLFTEDLTGTLQTVALDAKVQVRFDPDVVASYRLLGYEDRAIADRDFRDPRTDAGAIGAGHEVTALYDIRMRDDAHDKALGSVQLRWTEPGASEESTLRQAILPSIVGDDFRSAESTFQLDAIVAAAAGLLRDDPNAKGTSLRDVLDFAERSSEALPQTEAVHDFLEFLRRADELGG